MSTQPNWETVLKESRFDLPRERWDALEARLRERIRQDAALSAPSPSPWERVSEAWTWILGAFEPAPVRWGMAGGLAVALFATAILFHGPQTSSALASSFQWKAGDVLDAQGVRDIRWEDARVSMHLDQARLRLEEDRSGKIRLRLESGTAAFQVDHRTAEESFQVAFDACHIEVVGTAFTIRLDSLQSSATVTEGRVRFVGPDRQSFLDAGQSLSCYAQAGPLPPSPLDTASTLPVTSPLPSSPSRSETSRPAPATSTPADLAFQALAKSCLHPGSACTEARADFVRRFPEDARSPEVAWLWGESAKADGDVRDALFAWDVASRSQGRVGTRALLAASEIRLVHLADAKRAARDLDRALASLDPGSTLWIRAWSLRRDAARRLGDLGTVARADSFLAQPARVGGP
ncbi:MAG: FecR domain-containing protein [Fibrobacteria bacterium]|nr:FecR domain-containing protein [Fibrobacteria bacterium]